jgi:dihydroneopterin aldolase
VKKQIGKKSYLLENIAGRILGAIYGEMGGIKKVTISVLKMNPPIGREIGLVDVIMGK